MKWHSLVRITQHRGENQILRSKLLWRWSSLRTRKKCRHSWEWFNTCKVHTMSVSPSRANEGPHQSKFTLCLGVQNIPLQWIQFRKRWYEHPSWSTVLQMDTSCKGLGACLLQDGHPIYFASKSLTDAEKGYVAIELEALAVSWACEKFHHFLYGSHFILQTDQKPLESILAWPLSEATPRLQRLIDKSQCIWLWCRVHSRSNKSSCRLSQLTWMHQGQHSSAQVESQCNYPAAVKPRWCNSRYQARNSQRWQAVTVEVCGDNRMARTN